MSDCLFFFRADCDVTRCLLGLGVAVAVGYVGYCCWTGKCCKGASEASGSTASGRINKSVMLSSEKVVNMVDMEDLSDKTVFCRCWKSKKVRFLHYSRETDI